MRRQPNPLTDKSTLRDIHIQWRRPESNRGPKYIQIYVIHKIVQLFDTDKLLPIPGGTPVNLLKKLRTYRNKYAALVNKVAATPDYAAKA